MKFLDRLHEKIIIIKALLSQSGDIFDHIEELEQMTIEELKEHGVVGKMSKSEPMEQTREWLIDDIKSLEMDDVFKIYKYVRRYCVANIDGLVDPLSSKEGK